MFMGIFLGLLFIWLPTSFGECPGFKLNFTGSTNKYVLHDHHTRSQIPRMNAITTCFWVRTTQSTRALDAILSYAHGLNDNTLLLGLAVGNFKIWILDSLGSSGCYRRSDVRVSDGKWHHICFTWQSGKNGRYSIFKDGELEQLGAIPCTSGRSLPGGGTLVLGQDQDIIGGKFQPKNAFVGELAELNIWNSVLSSEKIAKMAKSCIPSSDGTGNVKSWNDFSFGMRNLEKLESTCCSGKPSVILT